MGRMSAYVGRSVTWDFALKSELDLTPVMFREGYRLGPAPGVTVPPGYGQELV